MSGSTSISQEQKSPPLDSWRSEKPTLVLMPQSECCCWPGATVYLLLMDTSSTVMLNVTRKGIMEVTITTVTSSVIRCKTRWIQHNLCDVVERETGSFWMCSWQICSNEVIHVDLEQDLTGKWNLWHEECSLFWEDAIHGISMVFPIKCSESVIFQHISWSIWILLCHLGFSFTNPLPMVTSWRLFYCLVRFCGRFEDVLLLLYHKMM